MNSAVRVSRGLVLFTRAFNVNVREYRATRGRSTWRKTFTAATPRPRRPAASRTKKIRCLSGNRLASLSPGLFSSLHNIAGL